MKRINMNKRRKNIKEDMYYNSRRSNRLSTMCDVVYYLIKKLQPFLYSEVYVVLMYTCNVTCIRTKAIKMQPFYSCFRSIIFLYY